MKPQRIRLSRAKGWRLPENAIVVARPTKWGNPFFVGQASGVFPETNEILIPSLTLEQCIEFYRAAAIGIASPEMYPLGHNWQARLRVSFGCHPTEAIRSQLRGKNLACWCPLGVPCHADILLELANQ